TPFMGALSFTCHPRLNPPRFPELCVLDERVISVEQRQDQARHPVQEALAQRVHFEESKDRMRHELMSMKLPPSLMHLFRHECRVPAHLPQVLAEVAKWVLQDVAAQV